VHPLVVGGGGMLAGVCRTLAERGDDVSVVARGRERLEALRADRITPVQVDYGDLDAFTAALGRVIEERGSIDLAVCWIRSWQPEALHAVAAALRPNTPLLHVLGTAGSEAAELTGVDYRVVRLGRKGYQWLTDEEISAGVVEVLDSASADFFVGEP
jgi:NAD(P)-dependent dehydrogenase (short-subunit alcohol dehydrogenase family)